MLQASNDKQISIMVDADDYSMDHPTVSKAYHVSMFYCKMPQVACLWTSSRSTISMAKAKVPSSCHLWLKTNSREQCLSGHSKPFS